MSETLASSLCSACTRYFHLSQNLNSPLSCSLLSLIYLFLKQKLMLVLIPNHLPIQARPNRGEHSRCELINIVFRKVGCKCRHPPWAFDPAMRSFLIWATRLQEASMDSKFLVNRGHGQDMFVFADLWMPTCKEEAPATSLLSVPMESDKHAHHQLHSCTTYSW